MIVRKVIVNSLRTSRAYHSAVDETERTLKIS